MELKGYPGVTSILRAVGIYSSYPFIANVHRLRGQAVHLCCEAIDRGEEPRCDQLEIAEFRDVIINGYAKGFREFKRTYRFSGICWECVMVSQDPKYSGCFDVIGRFADKPELILMDIKSGGVPTKVPVQLAAYEELLYTGTPFEGDHEGWGTVSSKLGIERIRKVSLRLDKTGTFKLYSSNREAIYDDPIWTAKWRDALQLYYERFRLLEAV